jgi:hypothetical protein
MFFYTVPMANVLEYLQWRGDLTFEHSPFNPVDNIILSLLASFPFDGIVPGPPDTSPPIPLEKAAARLFDLRGKDAPQEQMLQTKDAPRLLELAATSERFRRIGLTGYVNHIDIVAEKQFSALSAVLQTGWNNRDTYIAFRGTDNTLVGWKEDFNMSFMPVVPAQREAAAYVRTMAARLHGPLRLGGHSKGGNLAAYAGAFCGKKLQKRISAVYCNDSPGFSAGILAGEEYRAISRNIQSFIPQSSVVGMLFEHEDDYTVVKSSETGLLQHNAYSWEVTYNDVVRLDTVSSGSRFVDKTLKEWVAGLNAEQLRQFVDALYEILSSTEAGSFSELTGQRFKSTVTMLQSLGSADKKTKELIGKLLGELFRAARHNLGSLFPALLP